MKPLTLKIGIKASCAVLSVWSEIDRCDQKKKGEWEFKI